MSPIPWLKSDLFRISLLTALFAGAMIFTWVFDLGNELRNMPHLVVYLITIIWIIGAIQVGFWLGAIKQRGQESRTDSTPSPVTSVNGALMGLLAFMLAFTFNLSMTRFNARKTLYIDQVNAIEDCYRRASLLPERYRTLIEEQMIRYIDLRIGVIDHTEKIPEMVVQSDAIHYNLWGLMSQMHNDDDVTGAMESLFSGTLSNLIQAHNKRTTIEIINHLPTPMWIALYLLVAAAMAGMGYNFGLATRMNWVLILLFSLSFSAVVILISDLDRSGSTVSVIEFNQGSMIDLKERLLNQ